MAVNYDLTAGTSDLLFQAHDQSSQVLTKVIDWAKFTGTAAGTTGQSAAIITIPAGFVVEDVYYKTVVAATTASTMHIGDSSDAVYYFAADQGLPAAAAGTVVFAGQVAGGASGKFKDIATVTTLCQKMLKPYTAASQLVVTLGTTTAPIAGKTQFYVRGFQLL